jgi:hypothetical protein
MALTLRDERRGVPAARDYRVISDKRALLQNAAAWMMPIAVTQDEQTSVDRERVVGQMDHWISERRLHESSGEEMCKFYVERAELLREPLVGKIEFVHRTFQEYLTACELIKEDPIEELFPRLADAHWREVIVLAAGLAKRQDRERLLKAITDADTLDLQKKLVLMLDCMEVAGSNMTQRQREEAVSALSELSHLKKLVLRGTGVSDVSALAGLTNLQQLDLSYTGVSDVSVLAGLTNLQRLSLRDTGVSDVSGLAGLMNLQELDLSRIVSGLDKLPYLKKLVLRGTGVSDVRGLTGLTHLQLLDVRGTPVIDLRPLADLSALCKLAVSPHQWTPENEAALRQAHPQIVVFVKGTYEYIPELDND